MKIKFFLALVFLIIVSTYAVADDGHKLQPASSANVPSPAQNEEKNSFGRVIAETGRALQKAFSLDRPKAVNPKDSNFITLAVDGYGYVVGDVVAIDRKAEPKLYDVVAYNPTKNNSLCYYLWGSDALLAKVVGLPGESITFHDSNLIIRDQVISSPLPQLSRAIFGGKIYENLENVEIVLQEGEYLADKMVGQECSGLGEHGSSVPYKRFTVNKEALIGVVIDKVGHDDKAEQDIKNRQY